MPAYSQSTIRTPSAVAMKFAFSRSLWQGTGSGGSRAASISFATSLARSYASGTVTPYVAAVAA